MDPSRDDRCSRPTCCTAFAAHGQEHVLAGWDIARVHDRAACVRRTTQPHRLRPNWMSLARTGVRTPAPMRPDIAPLPVAPPDGDRRRRQRGLARRRCARGEVAALVVAGGQGSRLGFEKPKGMYPVGPVSGASLFQIHAEKVLALGRRYGKPVPFLVMTSPATDAETRDVLRGAPLLRPAAANRCYFFQQGTMPALICADAAGCCSKHRAACSSARTATAARSTALAESGLLDEIARPRREARLLLPGGQPAGEDRATRRSSAGTSQTRSEASSQGRRPRSDPKEKVGVLRGRSNGRCRIIEYSDLPRELAEARDADGDAALPGRQPGHPPVHRASSWTRDERRGGLPFHVARKKVPYLDPETGDDGRSPTRRTP